MGAGVELPSEDLLPPPGTVHLLDFLVAAYHWLGIF